MLDFTAIIIFFSDKNGQVPPPSAIGSVRQCKQMIELKRSAPSEEFELTANSLSAHIETHGKLILRIFHEFHETCHSVTFYFIKKKNPDFLILAESAFYRI